MKTFRFRAGKPRRQRTRRHVPTRQGVVLFTVLAILAVGMVVLGLVARDMVREHRQCRLRHDDRQCHRLAQAGLARGLARLASDENYDGEQWTIPAEDLKRDKDARVTIRLEATDSGERMLLATAAYPATDSPHCQHTERKTLP